MQRRITVNQKMTSGLVGMIFGGAWLLHNLQYFQQQGFVAIGMPLIITVLGVIYFVSGRKQNEDA